MSDGIFNDLHTSMQQAEAIAKGEMQPASVTRYDIADTTAALPDWLSFQELEKADADFLVQRKDVIADEGRCEFDHGFQER